MSRRHRRNIKHLWDEYRLTKQSSEGKWWLIAIPDPPAWFIRNELKIR